MTNLKTKLDTISKVFDIKKVLRGRVSSESIQRYYAINKLAYTLFHSRKGYIHVGISREGKYKDEDLVEIANDTGFAIEMEEDISKFIVPTMEKVERRAAMYFKSPRLAKALKSFLPEEFLYNAITGYLWADVVKEGIACYYITVLGKG